MSCQYCPIPVGATVSLLNLNVICGVCEDRLHHDEIESTYVGKQEELHVFVISPVLCSNQHRIVQVTIPCDEGIDITAEFQKISLCTYS